MIIESIQCDNPKCKKIMENNSNEFISYHTNIHVNVDGILIGRDVEKRTGTTYAHYCWNCFETIIKESREKLGV